jgi:hypothetical protein
MEETKVNDKISLSKKALAVALDRKETAINDLEKAGMPVVRIPGKDPMYIIEDVLAWLRKNGYKERGE